MKEPVWIDATDCLAVHSSALERFGGADGLRDEGPLLAALDRPKNLFAYGKPDPFDLAGSYASGIIKNHPFLDGNKRTGFLTATLFLECNQYLFSATEEQVVERTLALASGAIPEADYTEWLRESSETSD
ncbi:MAG: type II toxin-antitoxin system death-on-curing family toxin [Verrucomicrobiota bacterium]